MAARINNIRTETAGTEEEVDEGLKAALEMDVEEVGKGEEEGERNRRALGAL